MESVSGPAASHQDPAQVERPVLICLLGSFRLCSAGRAVQARGGGKTEALLSCLALGPISGIARAALLDAVWPGSEPVLAGQSLNSLLYSLHKLVGDALGGAPPVLRRDSWYRLNREAGVSTDVEQFHALADAGESRGHEGDTPGAMAAYRRALDLYRGDLCVSTDLSSVMERERLRARYLTLLARLADYYYAAGDYVAGLDHALRLLATDPCREDAHRLEMRCYLRQGQRAQALRQYRLCEQVLRVEFDAPPEPATRALFEQVRLDPGSV